MKILLCLLLLVILVLLLRVRFIVSYDEDGVLAFVRVLFFKIKIPPEKKKPKAVKKEATPNTEKKGGSLEGLKDIILSALKTLSPAIKSIRIDKLCGKITIASDDAFKTAMMFGSSAAGVGILLPVLENNFKIKKKDIEVNADFESTEALAILSAKVSIAIWQILYLGIIFISNFIKQKKGKI